MSTADIVFISFNAVLFALAFGLLVTAAIGSTQVGEDLFKALQLVIRRRLRIWARGHGVRLWEDAE